MNKRSKTKIICTIGPASESIEMIEKLFLNGMAIARINMSHGTTESHLEVIRNIRSVEEKHNTKIFIAMDTRGPELRVSCVPQLIDKDESIVLIPFDASCTPEIQRVFGINIDSLEGVECDSIVRLDDSKLTLKVEVSDKKHIQAIALNNHFLENGKRIHFESKPKGRIFSDRRDAEELEGIAESPIDAIFVSFVEASDDLKKIRKIINNKTIQLVAKIESKKAVDNIEEILSASDGIMIARGDLMNDVGFENLFSHQKKLIQKNGGKPVIMATEMLESMIDATVPLRAEVSDIGNAIFDGCSGIMLSSETAIGKHPEQCVDVMRKVAIDAERCVESGIEEVKFIDWEGEEMRSRMLEPGTYFRCY